MRTTLNYVAVIHNTVTREIRIVDAARWNRPDCTVLLMAFTQQLGYIMMLPHVLHFIEESAAEPNGVSAAAESVFDHRDMYALLQSHSYINRLRRGRRIVHEIVMAPGSVAERWFRKRLRRGKANQT